MDGWVLVSGFFFPADNTSDALFSVLYYWILNSEVRGAFGM